MYGALLLLLPEEREERERDNIGTMDNYDAQSMLWERERERERASPWGGVAPSIIMYVKARQGSTPRRQSPPHQQLPRSISILNQRGEARSKQNRAQDNQHHNKNTHQERVR